MQGAHWQEGGTYIPNSFYLIKDIDPYEKQIFLVINSFRYVPETLGEEKSLSVNYLHKITGISLGKISSSLKNLEAKGYIEFTREYDAESHTPRTIRPLKTFKTILQDINGAAKLSHEGGAFTTRKGGLHEMKERINNKKNKHEKEEGGLHEVEEVPQTTPVVKGPPPPASVGSDKPMIKTDDHRVKYILSKINDSILMSWVRMYGQEMVSRQLERVANYVESKPDRTPKSDWAGMCGRWLESEFKELKSNPQKSDGGSSKPVNHDAQQLFNKVLRLGRFGKFRDELSDFEMQVVQELPGNVSQILDSTHQPSAIKLLRETMQRLST